MKFKRGDLVEYWSLMDLRWGNLPQKGIFLEKAPAGTYEVYMIKVQRIIEIKPWDGTKLSPINPQEAQSEV